MNPPRKSNWVKPYNPQISRKFSSTSGVADRGAETFADVRRAVNKWCAEQDRKLGIVRSFSGVRFDNPNMEEIA